jgi:hypothetical protein
LGKCFDTVWTADAQKQRGSGRTALVALQFSGMDVAVRTQERHRTQFVHRDYKLGQAVFHSLRCNWAQACVSGQRHPFCILSWTTRRRSAKAASAAARSSSENTGTKEYSLDSKELVSRTFCRSQRAGAFNEASDGSKQY